MQITDDTIQFLSGMPVAKGSDELAFHNPSESMQQRFVAASYQEAYSVAARFLNYLLANTSPTRLLDFGCGWGRMLRLLRRMPELDKVEMHGCDLIVEALDSIRMTVPRVWLTPCETDPPCEYRDGMFDLIYAYSVFSHLSQRPHMAWAREFRRILAPGGRVCVTTQPRGFFKLCQDFREGTLSITHPWHERLAASFAEGDCVDRYDAGEFMFAAQGGHGDPTVYGQAVVPRQFFERAWGELGFRLVDWNDSDQQAWALLASSA